MTLEEILAGESKNLEFKVRRPKDSIKYMKSVVAFANGEGGRIIFGVDDKTHQVEGIPEEQVFSEIDAITEAISDSCEPAIIPDVYLQTLEGKTINDHHCRYFGRKTAAIFYQIPWERSGSLCPCGRYKQTGG